MKEMDTKELGELLLAGMYEETEALGHVNFLLSIDEIAVNIGLEDRDAVIGASRFLEEKGYIVLAFDLNGAMGAFITPSGEELVEKGGETGIIDEYRHYRTLTGGSASSAPCIDTPMPEPGITFHPMPDRKSGETIQDQDIASIITSMELLIRNDSLLDDSARDDLAADLRSLELQISKKTINKPLVDAILADLKKITSLSPLLDLLMSMKGI